MIEDTMSFHFSEGSGLKIKIVNYRDVTKYKLV